MKMISTVLTGLFCIGLINGHTLVRRQVSGSGSGSIGISASGQIPSFLPSGNADASSNLAANYAGVPSNPSLSTNSFSNLGIPTSTSPNNNFATLPASYSNSVPSNNLYPSNGFQSPTSSGLGSSSGLNLGSRFSSGLETGMRIPNFGQMFSDSASSLSNLISRISGNGLNAALGGTTAARNTISDLADQGQIAVDAGLGYGSDAMSRIQSSLRNYATDKMNLINGGVRTTIDAAGDLGQTGLGLVSLYPRLGLDIAGAFGR